jgi:hypothetical protein
MINFVCVLKESEEFTPQTVELLYNQVKRNVSDSYFICFSDSDDVVCDELRPLTDDLPGWWSIMEAFQCEGPVIFVGLDTVITSNIDELCNYIEEMPEDEFMMIRKLDVQNRRNEATWNAKGWASGIMGWNGDVSWIYKEFDYARDEHLKMEQKYTSQKLIERNMNVTCAQDVMDGVYSYKWNCSNKLPRDSKIVLFHGLPRPADVKELEWMQKHHR